MRTRRRFVAVWIFVVIAVATAVAALTRLAASVTTAAGVSCGSTWHVRSSNGGVFGGARSTGQANSDAQACLVAANGHWHAFVIFAIAAVVAAVIAVVIGVVARRP